VSGSRSQEDNVAFLKPFTYSVYMGRKKLPDNIREYFSKLGSKGGKKGGPARAANMTAEERAESARKAVLARWKKAKSS
jgi:hypothetical protein